MNMINPRRNVRHLAFLLLLWLRQSSGQPTAPPSTTATTLSPAATPAPSPGGTSPTPGGTSAPTGGAPAPTFEPTAFPVVTPAPSTTRTIPPTPTPPVTAAPTTAAPVTVAPTTAAPVTNSPTTAAPVTNAPTTAAPVTGAPTTAPVTAAPSTVAPGTEAPSTAAPATGVPTSVAPATANPSSAAPGTVAPTTASPTTTAPATDAPTPGTSTGTPSLRPTLQTAEPTEEGVPVQVTINDITSTFRNVDILTQSTIEQALQVTANWFTESYNGPPGGGGGGGRRLQVNPEDSGVRNMQTTLTLVGATNVTGASTITYNQLLSYVTTESDLTPDTVISIPYLYGPTQTKYTIALRPIPGFGSVAPVSVPEIPPPAPTMQPSDSPTPGAGGGEVLSGGAIAGIVIAGVVGIPLLGYGGYSAYKFAKNRGGSGSGGAGYVSAGTAPPSQLNVTSSPTGEEVSMMDDVVGKDSLDYQDQSVATVDYDYSKAYGGGGDTSVVSSAGGTMGDNTRQTAGEAATSTAAARAALGASFDSEGQYRDEESNMKEEVIEVDAPAGKLGVVIDTPDDGAPVVHAVKDSSVIADQICVGDKLIAVDDEDVRSMTAIKVSKLISKKSANPSRKLTIVRTSFVDVSEGD